jgi:hypothetical protein
MNVVIGQEPLATVAVEYQVMTRSFPSGITRLFDRHIFRIRMGI